MFDRLGKKSPHIWGVTFLETVFLPSAKTLEKSTRAYPYLSTSPLACTGARKHHMWQKSRHFFPSMGLSLGYPHIHIPYYDY
jgi:hypothetical protein